MWVFRCTVAVDRDEDNLGRVHGVRRVEAETQEEALALVDRLAEQLD